MNLVHRNANYPFVVWSACILWLISILAIIWSVTLFLVIGDILYMTGTDAVNADVLLSGIVLLPISMQMLYVIGYNKKIKTYTKVACCPLWICLMWSVVVNFCGIVLCFQRIAIGRCMCESSIRTSMKLYRVAPKHKRFIDSLQWYMRCCGLKSYRDWFSEDWYDKVRDYEWDPENKDLSRARTKQMDSVPLSCCKSGSCISNYLSELGTYSINTDGCVLMLNRLIIASMIIYIAVFIIVVIIQLTVIAFTLKDDTIDTMDRGIDFDTYNVKRIMDVKEHFVSSSSVNVDDEEESEPDDAV